jgi:hypothetical protein
MLDRIITASWCCCGVRDRLDLGVYVSGIPGGRRRCPCSSVGITAVIDVENRHDLLVVIDAVPDPVFTPARTMLSFERRTEWGSDALWVVCQRPEDELNTCCGHGFR